MKLEFESNTSTLPFAVSNFPAAVYPENGAANVPQMLQSGIKAAQNGDRNEARQLLIQVTEAEPENEIAWLWMASISEYPEELIIFLNNVLSINPNNARALEWMKATKSLLAQTFVRRGIEASNDVDKDFARQCFLQAVSHDNQNAEAWQSLAEISDSHDEKISHWQRVLTINPENAAAQDAIVSTKNQAVEAMLQKANRAAISGEREAAREQLQEVFKIAPELVEAWVLKSYLADSFSEKITCFEKVLTLDPENAMAMSGLASLHAMMAKTESRKAEQAAMIAQLKEDLAAECAILDEESIAPAESGEDENSPTQELEFPPDLLPFGYFGGDSEETTAISADEVVEFPAYAETNADDENFYIEPEQLFPPVMFEENPAGEVSAENNSANFNLIEESPDAPVEPVNNEYMNNVEPIEATSFETDYSPKTEFFSAADVEHFFIENTSKISAEAVKCPFCNADNEPNAFVCGSCRTILTLSDLEMLLAHTEANRDILQEAVERMETEKAARFFSADQLRTLAIGQINLKNLRQGIASLQKAAQLNPNDVMLGSQVNFLKIRMSEIEQQESASSQMIKGKTILVADDSATVRKLISSKLEKSGHRVVCAVDGVDALEKLKEFTPDLVLLDIMMPQLDGYQVCKIIRTNDLTKDVPIVMISGKDGFFDKVRGRMAGTSGYITKPFGPETLMRTVEAYIAPQKGETEEVRDEM
ncbi:MAG: response regulator [Pyrinomonadaceae bacterium]|nr:response regulator [Pyrinomonadaceae bacterium]